MSPSEPRRERVIVAVASVLIGATRLLALSRSPWDWDEVQFCLGVEEFDVASHSPHPPGFPLFIAAGQLLRPIAGSEFHALQMVVFLAAVALFPLFYLLARALRFDFEPALGAAAIFTLLPNLWYYGGTVFTDVPALACYLGAITAFFCVERNPRLYIVGSICLGAALLIRPHGLLVAVFPWTVATFQLLRARRLRVAMIGVVATVVIVAIGYGSAMLATGKDAYINAVRLHGAYVAKTDAIGNAARTPLSAIFRMQVDPYHAGTVSLVLNILALAGVILGRRRVMAAILLTFAPPFVFVMLTANATAFSRMSLGYIGGIVLLAAEGLVALTQFMPKYAAVARIVVFAAIAGRFFWWMLPALETVRTTIAPPVAAVLWIRDHVNVHVPVFVHGSMGPWARYYLRRHRLIALEDKALAEATLTGPAGLLVAEGDTQNMHARKFVRERLRIWNIVPHRYFEATVQKSSDNVHFGDGWYLLEGEEVGKHWRWSGPQSTMLLPAIEGRGELRLRLEVPVEALGPRTEITFTANGHPLGKLTPTERLNEVRFDFDSRRGVPNILRIEVGNSFRAPGDARELAISLLEYGWRPR